MRTLGWCLREWQRGLRGSGIIIFCLTVGVAAMTAIGTVAAAMRMSLEMDARAILGGDVAVSLTSREIPPPQFQTVARFGEVSTTWTLRTMLHGRGGSVLVEVLAVDQNYPLYGELVVAGVGAIHGRWLPSDGLIADPEILSRLGVALGDTVRLGDAQFRIHGVLEKEPGRSHDLFTLGPRVLISQPGLQSTGLLVPGSLFEVRYGLRLPPGSDAEVVAKALAQAGDPGWRVRPFSRASGRMETLLERLRTVSSFVALGILLVGGLGVASGVRAHMISRIGEIAIWKSLGASTQVLLIVHGGHIAITGGLAVVGGVALGAAAPWVLSRLGWQGVAPGWFPLPMLLSAGCGLAILLLFATIPLARAVAIPPVTVFRQPTGYSLSHPLPLWAWGVSGGSVGGLILLIFSLADRFRLGLWFVLGVGASFLLLWGASLGVRWGAKRLGQYIFSVALRQAMANLARPHSPGPRLVLLLGLGLGMLGAVRLVTAALTTPLSQEIAQQAPTFFVMDLPPDMETPFRAVLQTLPGVQNLRLAPVVRGRITHIKGQDVEAIQISPEVAWAVRTDRLLSSSVTLPPGSTLVAGKWWDENTPSAAPQISITADIAQGFGVSVGDSLGFNILGRQIEARIASIRQVDWTTLNLQFAVLFAPGFLEAAPRTLLGTIHVSPQEAEAVFQRLARAFPQVTLVDVRRILDEVVDILEKIGLGLAVLGGLAVAVGLVVLAGSFAAEQKERHYEAVVYKICGAPRQLVVRIFALEFLIAAAVASTLAVILAFAAAWAVVEGLLRLRFSAPMGDMVLVILSGGGGAVLLALWRTRAVLQLPAWTWLRND
jgi:putative ABC transport system permease protein